MAIPDFPDLRRKMLETYPHFFDHSISCLAMIPGETCRSGRSLGLDPMAKLAIISSDPERFSANDLMASQIRDQG